LSGLLLPVGVIIPKGYTPWNPYVGPLALKMVVYFFRPSLI
jgi:hypothetical protein